LTKWSIKLEYFLKLQSIMNEILVRLYHQYNPLWENKEIPSKYRFPNRRELLDRIVEEGGQKQKVIKPFK